MPSVLVVDDSALDLRLASRMLEEIGLVVSTATDGREALLQLNARRPDLILTDIQMPHLNGLELVREIAKRRDAVPVVIMTAFGSEETAVEALKAGAASYVPKQNLARDLVSTVRNVLALAASRRDTPTLMDSLTRLEAEYVLDNRLEGLDDLIAYIKSQLRHLRLFGEGDILRVGTALYEAMVNAIEHGNLEIDSSLRETDGIPYARLVEERNLQPVFRARHVRLTTTLTRTEARFVVRDQGRGFDPRQLPDPTAPENVDKTNGRGLFLIRTFMDEVYFNDIGNEITMIKNRVDRSA